MRVFSVLVALSFTLLTNAQNFSSYVPECAPPCVEQTLNSSKVCTGLDDNKCLCTNISQVLFPSIECFSQTCNNTNLQELRSEIVSGWQKFCNDSGTPASLSMGGWRPGGPNTPISSASTTSPVTTSNPTTLSTSTTSTSAMADATSPAASPDLSTGAKAGIGVGAGVGSLALITGLVFIGFRLGQQRKERSRSEAESTVPFNGEQPDGGGGLGGAEFYKPDAEAIPLSELHPQSVPPAEMPAHDIRELPVTETPAELWHNVLPTELSADAEIPRDRVWGTARL